jgi:hypothetical protein
LGSCLLNVVAVQVHITSRPYELTRFKVTLLRDHVREKGIAGDVKWDTQKVIRTSLVKLAGESAP